MWCCSLFRRQPRRTMCVPGISRPKTLIRRCGYPSAAEVPPSLAKGDRRAFRRSTTWTRTGPGRRPDCIVTGLTYIELYHRSGLEADSRCRPGAARAGSTGVSRQRLPGESQKPAQSLPGYQNRCQSPPPPGSPTPSTSPVRNPNARRTAIRAAELRVRTKHRDVWLACIDQYRAAYEADSGRAGAAVSLFKMGSLYQQLAGYSKNRSDRETGEDHLRRLISRFPGSPYSPMAEALLGITPHARPRDGGRGGRGYPPRTVPVRPARNFPFPACATGPTPITRAWLWIRAARHPFPQASERRSPN